MPPATSRFYYRNQILIRPFFFFNPADFFPSFFFFLSLSLSVPIDPKRGKSLLILNPEKIGDRVERACQDRATRALSPGKVTKAPAAGGNKASETKGGRVKEVNVVPSPLHLAEEEPPISASHQHPTLGDGNLGEVGGQ